MKKTLPTKTKAEQPDELAPEYRFDYRKGKTKPVREAGTAGIYCSSSGPDVAQVFETGDTVNAVLRALMTTMPTRRGSSHR